MAGPLETQIHEALTAALRAGDKVALGALRLLATSITNREKELRRPLTDDEVREVAGREAKKRVESIEAFEAAGRTELAERERAEREVVAAYAPEQLSDEEVAALVEEAFAQTGAEAPQDLGKVMGYVMGRAKGRVDGGAVQRLVRQRLG